MADKSKPIELTLTSGAGADLKFRSMSAHEEVSRLFEAQIVGVAKHNSLSADDVLGKPVAVCMDLGSGHKRWFHGIATAFGIEGRDGEQYSYRIVARPWLWLLTRSADLRIFQDKSALDIIKQVLGEYPAGSVTVKARGPFKTRSYCVQYRETDFNFVSRLMEEEGIFYWFDHSEAKHDLVLADSPNVHQAMAGYEDALFRSEQAALGEMAVITRWAMRHEIQPGKVTLRDYDFERPSTDLQADSPSSSRKHAEAGHEIYDSPGGYLDKGTGKNLAAIRLEESTARFGRFHGDGNTPGLVVGRKFTLKEHPRADQNIGYLVLATQIDVSQTGERSAGQGGGFLCRFSAQSLTEAFRPARTTRKPTVAGPQTAKVVGSGDAGDIFTDKYGRVKVQFHWDRLGKNDNTSSCWMRVSSPWAGNGFGMLALPRLGQEVVVDFLEGDPDQPIITGRVHNAEQMPPYELPANASVSTLKSRSVKGGTADFNELRFEDKKGSEYVLFHAQKDRLEFVEKIFFSEIGEDEHRTVKKDRKERIDGEHHLTVTKDVKQKFSGKFSLEGVKDLLLKAGELFSLKTGKDITAKAGTGVSFESGTATYLKAGTDFGAEGGTNVHIKGGMNVVIEAGMQLTLKAGGNSVVLGPAGVSITGAPMVNINSGGSAGSGGGIKPVAPTDPDAPEKPKLPEDPLKDKHR